MQSSKSPSGSISVDPFMQAAIEEARKGLAAGGIPIGSVLVHRGEIIGRGHNQRVQNGSVIHHAEMNCLENAGRLPARVYRECVLYSTLSPCAMCSGAAQLYGIPKVVVGGKTKPSKGQRNTIAAGESNWRYAMTPSASP